MINKIFSPKLSELLPLYHQSLMNKNRRMITLYHMASFEKWLGAKWGARRVVSITTRELREIANECTDETRVKCVLALFRWFHREKIIKEDITKNVFEHPGRRVRNIKYLEPEDAHKFLDAVNPQYKAAFALSLYAGLRPFEVCRIKWGSLFIKERRITVPADVSKTWEFRSFEAEKRRFWRLKVYGKTIEIMRDCRPGIPPVLFEVLAPLEQAPYEYVLPARGDREGTQLFTRVFETLRHERRRAARKAGVTLGNDIFRHTFLTYLVALNHDVGLAAKVAGHRNLQMLERHYDGKATRVNAEAFFKLPVTVGDEPDVVDVPGVFAPGPKDALEC
jgi:integrase